MTHPAACPYCGGTVVNAATIDIQIRHALLREDGTLVIGDVTDGCDWQGQDMLFCHGCSSTYAIPVEVHDHFDDGLRVDYPDRSPRPGEPRHIGADVKWVPEPVVPFKGQEHDRKAPT